MFELHALIIQFLDFVIHRTYTLAMLNDPYLCTRHWVWTCANITFRCCCILTPVMILMPPQSDAGEWQAFRSEEHWIISYKLSCFCYLAVPFICVLFYFVHIGQVCGDHDDTGQDLLSAHHLRPVHTGRTHLLHHGPAHQASQRHRKYVWVWSVCEGVCPVMIVYAAPVWSWWLTGLFVSEGHWFWNIVLI